MNWKSVIKEILILSAIALILAFSVNAVSPKGLPFKGQWDKNTGLVTAKPLPPTEQEKIIELPKAKELFESGVLFVDARSPEDYNEGHIKGAVSLPVESFYDIISSFQAAHPESTAIVTYCNGRECSDSRDLAENLNNVGYQNVRIFIDGFPLWSSQKLPIEKK